MHADHGQVHVQQPIREEVCCQPADPITESDEDNAPLSSSSGPEAFDISPGQGILQPKQEVDLDFCFYAPEYSNARAVAVCDVEKGPTYKIPLSAATGDIRQVANVVASKEALACLSVGP